MFDKAKAAIKSNSQPAWPIVPNPLVFGLAWFASSNAGSSGTGRVDHVYARFDACAVDLNGKNDCTFGSSKSNLVADATGHRCGTRRSQANK